MPAEPTKEANLAVTYEFSGWDPVFSPTCNGTVTYTATYRSVYIDYKVTFQYEDGTMFHQLILHYGDSVEMPYEPAAMDGFYFAGWDKDITICRGDATYTAVFKRIRIPGDIDGNETVTEEDAVYLLLYTMFGDAFYPIGEISADIDGNGLVDQDDAVYLLLHTMFGDMFYPLQK